METSNTEKEDDANEDAFENHDEEQQSNHSSSLTSPFKKPTENDAVSVSSSTVRKRCEKFRLKFLSDARRVLSR